MNSHLKPNKTAFVWYRFARNTLASLVSLFIIGVAASFFVKAFLPLTIFFILSTLYTLISYTIQYRKEEYHFLPDKIIRASGGIFSDHQTELALRNITTVALTLPFIENKLFSTGRVSIQSAGSAAAEVTLFSIDQPQELYTRVEGVMRQGGFRLQKDKLIQQERPNLIGVLLEVFKNFFGLLVFLFFGALWLFEEAIVRDTVSTLISPYLTTLAVMAGLFVFIGGFSWTLLTFLDLKSRVYKIYSDTITYSEGFLTKHYAFIPIENLSDAAINQTLIDKLLGLYDIVISCQGAGSEIVFKNMENGEKLEANIDHLIAQAKPRHAATATTASKDVRHARTPTPFRGDTAFTATYQMDKKRTLVPLLVLLPICLILFFLLPFWVITFVGIFIKMAATTYFVKERSMQESYRFLSTKEKEFTNDKITGVIFKENPLDWLFGTFTINFWSIGSAESISFKHLKKDEKLLGHILAKLGIKSAAAEYTIHPAFSFSAMLRANLPLTVIMPLFGLGLALMSLIYPRFLLLLILLVLLIGALVAYRSVYYQKSSLAYIGDYLQFRRGLIFTEDYYVFTKNIKDVTTLRYPFSSLSNITFDVAGEHLEQTGNNQKVMRSNQFTIRYATDIPLMNRLVDELLLRNVTAKEIPALQKKLVSAPTSLLYAKPDLANYLVVLIGVSLVLFPLIILLPITLPLTLISLKMRSYALEENRAVARSGIFYKKQTTVLYSKIDHITAGQGLLNKVFGNGTITVNTVGSSRAELTVRTIPNYKEFYEMLKKHY